MICCSLELCMIGLDFYFQSISKKISKSDSRKICCPMFNYLFSFGFWISGLLLKNDGNITKCKDKKAYSSEDSYQGSVMYLFSGFLIKSPSKFKTDTLFEKFMVRIVFLRDGWSKFLNHWIRDNGRSISGSAFLLYDALLDMFNCNLTLKNLPLVGPLELEK